MSESTVTRRRPVGKDVSTKRRIARSRRHFRLRKKVAGTATRPRLVVNRSSRHIVAQIVDDLAGHTLASASSLEADVRALEGDKKAHAAKVGQLVAACQAAPGTSSLREAYAYQNSAPGPDQMVGF